MVGHKNSQVFQGIMIALYSVFPFIIILSNIMSSGLLGVSLDNM